MKIQANQEQLHFNGKHHFCFMLMIFYGMKVYACCKIIQVLFVTRKRVDLKQNICVCMYVCIYIYIYIYICVCVCVCVCVLSTECRTKS